MPTAVLATSQSSLFLHPLDLWSLHLLNPSLPSHQGPHPISFPTQKISLHHICFFFPTISIPTRYSHSLPFSLVTNTYLSANSCLGLKESPWRIISSERDHLQFLDLHILHRHDDIERSHLRMRPNDHNDDHMDVVLIILTQNIHSCTRPMMHLIVLRNANDLRGLNASCMIRFLLMFFIWLTCIFLNDLCIIENILRKFYSWF